MKILDIIFKPRCMERATRSFEFRMCKKVAELTQVVHVLFTRNHEKEVELSALREAYELEIEALQWKARTEIDREGQDGTRQEEHRSLLEEYNQKEKEWYRKLAAAETSLKEEIEECRHLRDLLINAQKDIEQLRQDLVDQLASKSKEITRRDKDVEQLKRQVISLEGAHKDSSKEAQNIIRTLEKSMDKLKLELTEALSLADENHRAKEKLIAKNKNLEGEIKSLRRELNIRASERVTPQPCRVERSVTSLMGRDEEVERLRREVSRYRLELSNREASFNRVFADQRPVLVESRDQRRSQTSAPVLYRQHSLTSLSVRQRPQTPTYGIETPGSSVNSYLPCIPADGNRLFGRVFKPMPPSPSSSSSK